MKKLLQLFLILFQYIQLDLFPLSNKYNIYNYIFYDHFLYALKILSRFFQTILISIKT